MNRRCPDGKTYAQGHRCDHCREWHRRERSKSRYRQLQRAKGGVYPLDTVPARESQDLVKAALKRGLTKAEIHRISGVGRPTITRIFKQEFIQARTARKLHNALADEDAPRKPLPGARIPKKKYAQIVRSLEAQGWALPHLEYIVINNSDATACSLQGPLREANKYVNYKTAERLEWLAKAIGDRTGPSHIVAMKMLHRGYFPLKHYNVNGDLIASTLSPTQKRYIKGV